MTFLSFVGNLAVVGFCAFCIFGCVYHLAVLFESRYRRPTRR